MVGVHRPGQPEHRAGELRLDGSDGRLDRVVSGDVGQRMGVPQAPLQGPVASSGVAVMVFPSQGSGTPQAGGLQDGEGGDDDGLQHQPDGAEGGG